MYKNFDKEIRTILEEHQILQQERLDKHTTFRMGGPADYFLQPRSEQIVDVITLCNQEKLPFYILGNGSNILASDDGYKGVIVQIGSALSTITFEEKKEGTLVTAQAGVLLSKLAHTAAENSLTGMEFSAGIPGTLGGAVAMNAGAYGGEIKDHICDAKVLTRGGELLTLSREQLQLGYRSSIVQKENYIVIEATFLLQTGEKKDILDVMADLQKKRKEKQPLEYPSAGSTFKRPEGHFAGKLIEDAGLRGYRVGDVMVSEKHCGFVVNVGKGTAKDTQKLMKDVERIVKDRFGVQLEPEVRFLG